jgi:hypothetical protein
MICEAGLSNQIEMELNMVFKSNVLTQIESYPNQVEQLLRFLIPF